MNRCKKYKLPCIYCLRDCLTDCIATERECEEYRKNPIKLHKRYCTKLPCPMENWQMVYRGLVNLPQIDLSKVKDILLIDCQGNKLLYCFLHINFMALSETLSIVIREERFENIAKIKRAIQDLIQYRDEAE